MARKARHFVRDIEGIQVCLGTTWEVRPDRGDSLRADHRLQVTWAAISLDPLSDPEAVQLHRLDDLGHLARLIDTVAEISQPVHCYVGQLPAWSRAFGLLREIGDGRCFLSSITFGSRCSFIDCTYLNRRWVLVDAGNWLGYEATRAYRALLDTAESETVDLGHDLPAADRSARRDADALARAIIDLRLSLMG